jgi:hypothetical protein
MRLRFEEERVPLPFPLVGPLDAVACGSDGGLFVASRDEDDAETSVRRFDPLAETALLIARVPTRSPRCLVPSGGRLILLADDGLFSMDVRGGEAPSHVPLEGIGSSCALFVSADGRRAVISSAFHDRCTLIALDSMELLATVPFVALDVVTGTLDDLSLVSTRTSSRRVLDERGQPKAEITSIPGAALDPTRMGTDVLAIATEGRTPERESLPYAGLMGLRPTNRVIAFEDDFARVFVGPPLAPRGVRRGPPLFVGPPLGATADGHVALHAKTDFGPEEIVLLKRATLRAVARHILFTEPIRLHLVGARAIAGLLATPEGTMATVVTWRPLGERSAGTR